MSERDPARSADRLLYHYTSAAGVLGILERRCLFATDIWFLNDAAEVRFAQARMIERLRHRDDLASDLEWLEKLLGVDPGNAVRDSLFVASFCEEPDLLSQWRGYAAGGFAIGFASGRLAELASSAGGRLVKVEYGREAGRPHLREVFEQVVAGGPYSEAERKRIARSLAPEMARVKEDSFAEEKEWRLLVDADADLQVRFLTRQDSPLPYVEFELPDPTPVREIVIGPGGDPQLRRRGIEQLLLARGYEQVAVRESASHLRF